MIQFCLHVIYLNKCNAALVPIFFNNIVFDHHIVRKQQNKNTQSTDLFLCFRNPFLLDAWPLNPYHKISTTQGLTHMLLAYYCGK